MKIYYSTAAQAQALSDRIHQWLIANDQDYAASVAQGQTTQWCDPQPNTMPGASFGDPPVVVDSRWFIWIMERCLGALTDAEKAAIV